MQFGNIKTLLFVLLVLTASCAKEIYTDEEAKAAKLEAQKVGLSMMIRDINDLAADMSGFTISGSQCGDAVSACTSSDGTAEIKVIRGDIVLTVEKEGYVTAQAVVTTPLSGSERSNTLVIIPVFSVTESSGTIKGTVMVNHDADTEPLSGALVTVDADIEELMNMAFPGLQNQTERYRPSVLTYSANLLNPVRTGKSGAFELNIPATGTELTYTIQIHETEFTGGLYCSGNRTVISNGKDVPQLNLRLTPYYK